MIDLDERKERYKCYQNIIDNVTFDECVSYLVGCPIGCNREEMIREAIIQMLSKTVVN